MKTLFSRRDLFAVFASVFMCVFMVGVITYGASVVDTASVGAGTSTPSYALGVKGAGIVEDFLYLSSFTATSTTATSSVKFGFNVNSGNNTFSVDGASGAVTIGTTTVPDADVVNTLSTDPGLTVSGVGSAVNATGTLYITGGGDTGGQIIMKSANGTRCGVLVFDSEAGALNTVGTLSTKIVACPR